jgi:hypothetical protein
VTFSQIHRFLLRYRAKTWQDGLRAILASLIILHFSVSTYLWALFAYSQIVLLRRISPPGLFWTHVWQWMPFFARVSKAIVPLEVAIVALILCPFRPRLCNWLIGGVLIYSAACASYDIGMQQWDLATFGPPWGGHMNHYFTWWWCHQRPR